jgi:hypothetical protein
MNPNWTNGYNYPAAPPPPPPKKSNGAKILIICLAAVFLVAVIAVIAFMFVKLQDANDKISAITSSDDDDDTARSSTKTPTITKAPAGTEPAVTLQPDSEVSSYLLCFKARLYDFDDSLKNYYRPAEYYTVSSTLKDLEKISTTEYIYVENPNFDDYDIILYCVVSDMDSPLSSMSGLMTFFCTAEMWNMVGTVKISSYGYTDYVTYLDFYTNTIGASNDKTSWEVLGSDREYEKFVDLNKKHPKSLYTYINGVVYYQEDGVGDFIAL